MEQAVALYQGDFLADLEDAEWAVQRREELRQHYLEALVTMGGLLFAESEYARAVGIYRQAIDCDSYMEAAHRELMRCLARQGEHGQALRHYQALAALMQNDFGSPPAPETRAVYECLRRGEEV